MFRLIRTDCYWHHCEHDMGASIDCCSLVEKLGECPCAMDCKDFISTKEVTKRLTPKPPVLKDRNVMWSEWVCPACGEVVGERFTYPGLKPHNQHKCNYCPKCGQTIDWRKIEK